MDPAALQILIARLTGITEEMGLVLRRAAASPNIKERADCSAALFTAAGELLVQAEHIPVHLGSMPASVAAAIAAFGDRCRPGDQVILNDPFAGGTHLNDVTLVAPCFAGGRLVAWVANRAHHADVGGMVPGSIPPAATEIQQEGLRLPPVLLDDAVARILAANSRTPEERRADLAAQAGANTTAVARLAELLAGGTGPGALAAVCDYGERRMRAALGRLPAGCWSFADVLEPAVPGGEPVWIRLEVTLGPDRARFDFTGTDPQQPGNVNAVAAVTVSAVAWALRSVADPTLPANGGAMRPVEVVAPAGTVVAAEPPAAVGAGNVEVSQRVADVCLGALAQAVPDRVPAAGQGTMNNLMVGGRGWVFYETVAGGQGGRPGGRAGMSAVHTAMTNTRDTPVEAFERAYPVRVRRYGVRAGSGGPGAAPGGDGLVKELEFLEPVTLSLVTERRTTAPWGLAGGGPGAVGENWVLRGGEEARAERVPARATLQLAAGDVLRILTPGGGGWGPPPAAGAPGTAGPGAGAPEPEPVVVRDATPGDLPTIVAIVNDVIATTDALWRDEAETLAERAAWLDAKRRDGWPVLVAERGGRVLGFCALGPFRAYPPGYALTAEHSIHVARGERGGGIGSALLDRMIAAAAASGRRVLVAAVDGGNAGSIRFHARHGFREVGRLPGVGRKFGRPVDLVLLQHELGAGTG